MNRIRERVGTAAAALVLVAATGVAWAADSAGPTDTLYPVDRGLERVAIFAGGNQERVAEAWDLVQRGDLAAGLEHAADTVPAPEIGSDGAHETKSNAHQALVEAAARVEEAGDEHSEEVRENVAALLAYLAENAGAIDGQTVAEMARGIAGAPDDAPPTEVQPVETSPVEAPPVEAPPVETPPIEEPPVDMPPTGQGA